MQIKVEFEAAKGHRLIADRAVGAMVAAPSYQSRSFPAQVMRCSNRSGQRPERRCCNGAATNNGAEFRIYDIDYIGLAAVENKAT